MLGLVPWPLFALLATLSVIPSSASAFRVAGFNLFAERWADGFGLEDGIDVGLQAGFATLLGAQTGDEIAMVNQAVEDAFAAWETPDLRFNITFEAPVVIGALAGFEIDLIALPASSPEWPDRLVLGQVRKISGFETRVLTNGVTAPGLVMLGADIHINIDLVMLIGAILPDDAARIAALTRLLMHEIGHAIGLEHPHPELNLDTDFDPTNPIVINPVDPLANVINSPNIPTDSIMTVRPCGQEYVDCPPLFYTALTYDDIGGRDYLYPHVPEPNLGVLFATASLFLGSAGSRRPRR